MNHNNDINMIAESAYNCSQNRDFVTASRYFYRAAEMAKNNLNDSLLSDKYLYLYYLERLKEASGQSIDDIDSVIKTVERISVSEDDKLEFRMRAVVNFFTLLKYCLLDDIEKVAEFVKHLRVTTEDESESQVESITHLLCESVLVREELEKCGCKLDKSSAEIFSKIASLEKCIKRHKKKGT